MIPAKRSLVTLRGETLRFLLAGGINTAATFALYWLLLPGFGYAVAYTIVFVLGIALSYVLNLLFVFKSSASICNAAVFPLVYLVQYLLGLATLAAWTEVLGLPPAWGVFASVAITLPVTFMLSRLVLKRL